MVAAFAQQAAIAIRNAGLYAELRGSLEEKLRLQEELHAKESERRALEEANRSRSELMEYVSHELRNPLTAILGFAQTLRSEAESLTSAERSEFTEAVETEASRMLVMINELLDSARIDAGRELSLSIRSIDPAPILRRAARSIVHSRHWTTAHRLSLNIEHDLGEIDADADKLQQILDNLLSNAVKYSPDGGDIRLACCRTEAGIEIEVSDQGIGMNAEQLGRLFQRFERSEEAALKRIAGTGLGLFLTKHLVELPRGRISCMSDPGKGSTFRVALPARTVNPPSG
jgi:signal transduction histidine kinase